MTGADFHAHLAPEDLLELALEQASGRAEGEALASALSCPACARALADLSAELAHVRGLLTRQDPGDARRASELAETVLARTTREDLSWRGDCREVALFLRGRLASSKALRLVAASLLLHLLALPVLAVALVLHVREARQPMRIALEPSEENLPMTQAPVEPRRELVREPEPDLPGAMPATPERPPRAERLERARLELSRRGAPVSLRASPPPEPVGSLAASVRKLLAARSQCLRLGGVDASLTAPAEQATTLEHSLWAELWLDDWVLRGSADPRLSQAIDRLAELSATDPDIRLARHALDRAVSYGFVVPGRAPAAEPLPSLDPAWFRAFEQAAARTPGLVESDAIAVWLTWGREHAR